MTHAANTSVDQSTPSPSAHSHPAVDDEANDDLGDGPRLTAVYVQSKKASAGPGARLDDVTGRCPSPALSSSRASPNTGSHPAPGRHRQTMAVSRTLPQIVGSGDGMGSNRQRVSFQVAVEPRSQSSTCIAAADAPPRRHTDVAIADHHRTSSSVDDMRTCRTPDRSPKPPRRDPRSVQPRLGVDVTARGADDSQSALHHVKTALDEITASPTDNVD